MYVDLLQKMNVACQLIISLIRNKINRVMNDLQGCVDI